MARPEPTFLGIVWWLQSRWGNVDSFGALARDGIPTTEAAVRANVENFLREMSEKPEMFDDPDGLAKFRERVSEGGFVEGLTRGHLENARAYLDAAVLIFAHSILVEAVAATYTLAERLDGSGVSAAAAAVPRRREERLLRQVAVLRRVFAPDVDAMNPTYHFDGARLERLVRLRGDIVHGHLLGDRIQLAEPDVEFLKHTGMYMVTSIFLTYRDRMTGHWGRLPLPAWQDDTR